MCLVRPGDDRQGAEEKIVVRYFKAVAVFVGSTLCAASVTAETTEEIEARLRFDVAHIFPTSEHAAAGTCFPKYHLELWRDEVAQKQELHARDAKGGGSGLECDAAAKAQIDWDKLRDYFRQRSNGYDPKNPDWSQPSLAVTLEGGGSKSAPFAMGALAGLHEAKLLDKVDIISSVSGGGYAAYYYFSRLLDTHKAGGSTPESNPTAWFKDCVPSVYRSHFQRKHLPEERYCNPHSIPRPGPPFKDPNERLHYYALDNIDAYKKQAPFQSHIRFYQDVLYPRGGMRRVDENYKDKVGTWGNVAWLGALHLITVPLHTVMNTFFSMPENSAPSRTAYRLGIERAYAHTSASWGGASQGEYKPEMTGGLLADQLHSRNHTLADLRELSGSDVCHSPTSSCKVPLWVINAAASGGRDLTSWLKVPSNDALRTSFEMTPFGHGSGTFGFTAKPPTLPLRDAVGSSAAFLDRDQRDFGTGWVRTAVNASLSAFNFEWGSDIANYNASPVRAALAHVTPLPLYHVSRERERMAPTIHLSDGGNTDNLGVLAAVRRGAKNVIVVAATGDGTGSMRSLCRAKNHLELDGTYRVKMEALGELDAVCSAQMGERERVVWGDAKITELLCVKRGEKALCECTDPLDRKSCQWRPDRVVKRGYDMWRWTHPVLVGWVERDPRGAEEKEIQRISQIHLVKPGIDTVNARKQLATGGLASAAPLCVDREQPFTHQIMQCDGKQDAMPCAALAFTVSNFCKAKEDLDLPLPTHPARHGSFPQHAVEITTLNSSYTLFGAYFDLGRHLARQLQPLADGKFGLQQPPDKQTLEPMQPYGVDK